MGPRSCPPPDSMKAESLVNLARWWRWARGVEAECGLGGGGGVWTWGWRRSVDVGGEARGGIGAEVEAGRGGVEGGLGGGGEVGDWARGRGGSGLGGDETSG